MVRATTRYALILLGAAILAGTALSGTASANVLGIHTMVQDNAETDQQLDQAAELCGWGGWVKQLMYVQDGAEWAFDSKWVRFVEGARKRHLNVVARLHYLPPAFRADPANFASKPKSDPDGSFNAYKDLIRDFVRRFDGRLHYAEIWNEPNLTYEWNEWPDPEEFVRAMMAGYDGVKEADPTCRVLFPGLAPTNGTPDGRNIDNITFIRRCLQSTYLCPRDGRPFKEHFDILGSHPYALNHPASYTTDKYSILGYQWEQRAMWEFRVARPVLITECGYALNNQDDPSYPRITEELRAQYMADAFRKWAADRNVMGAMPYFLHAEERTAGDAPFFWVRNDGSRTPQFEAVKALRPLLEDQPGNLYDAYGNAPRTAAADTTDIADAVGILRLATGADTGSLEPSRFTILDVAPAQAPDGALTLDDAARVLRMAAGLEAP